MKSSEGTSWCALEIGWLTASRGYRGRKINYKSIEKLWIRPPTVTTLGGDAADNDRSVEVDL